MTTYAYPWDLARLGVGPTLHEMAAHGIEAVDLAATYHPIDSLSPRGTAVGLFTSARGAVHFPARVSQYGRIQPQTSSTEVGATWPEVAAHAREIGLAVNAWTVTLFQPWIVDAYPDCARVLPSGDAIGSGVCAANDDVRDYLATLCADMTEQFGVDMIRLEGIMPAAFDLDWLRPRILVAVPPLARELLAICFCTSCRRRASAAGLDVDRLRLLVNQTIAAELEDGLVATDTDRVARLVADTELLELVAQHEQAAIELAQAAGSRIERAPAPKFSVTTWTPFSSLRAASRDAFIEDVAELVDQVTVMPGNEERNRRLVSVVARVDHPPEVSLLFTRLRSPAAGAHATTGEDVERIARDLQDAAAMGITEVSIYNYGLLRDRDIQNFMTAARASNSRAGARREAESGASATTEELQ